MSGINVFQRDKIPFRMLGKEFQYEFIPSIHFQEVLTAVGNLLMAVTIEEGEVTGVKNDALLPQVLEVTRDILGQRLYQIIADVLEHQNGEKIGVNDLKMKSRPLEIAQFLDLVIGDPEIREAFSTLGKSLAGLMTGLGSLSATPNSTPSSPTTSTSTESTSTGE